VLSVTVTIKIVRLNPVFILLKLLTSQAWWCSCFIARFSKPDCSGNNQPLSVFHRVRQFPEGRSLGLSGGSKAFTGAVSHYYRFLRHQHFLRGAEFHPPLLSGWNFYNTKILLLQSGFDKQRFYLLITPALQIQILTRLSTACRPITGVTPCEYQLPTQSFYHMV